MIEQINQTLDYALSKEGLQWRLEARRSGKSFAEVVLAKTLIYRVEQVLLIHRRTGLLLHNVSLDSSTGGQADMVSGMITAIQEFARDAFAAEESDVLKTMQMGELSVWLHGGPQALLAVVMRGTAPPGIREGLDRILEAVHSEFTRELAEFDGDADVFAGTAPLLEECLLEDRLQPKKSLPAVISLAALAAIGIGLLVATEVRDRMRWKQYIERLDQAPGVIVSEVYRRGHHYVLSGLRDPLSPDPEALLLEADLPSERVTFSWEAYNALSPEFVLARAREALRPPETVRLVLDDTRLVASGSAPRTWISEATLLAKALPGISDFIHDKLVDLDRSEYEILVWEQKEKIFEETRRAINAFSMPVSGPDALNGDALDNSVSALRDLLLKLASTGAFLNRPASLSIVARLNANAVGRETMNSASQKASGIHQALLKGGVTDIPISTRVEKRQSRSEVPLSLRFEIQSP